MDRLKSIFDWDCAKVIIAAITSIGGTAILVDYALKTIISLLTIWYLWRKVHPKKGEKDED